MKWSLLTRCVVLPVSVLWGFGCKEATPENLTTSYHIDEHKPLGTKTTWLNPQDGGEEKEQTTDSSTPMVSYDLPDYLMETLEHLEKINQLFKEHEADCPKAREAITGYLKENQEKLERIRIRAAETKKDASPNARYYSQQFKSLLEPVVIEAAKIHGEFAKNCPEDAKALGESMKQLNPKQ